MDVVIFFAIYLGAALLFTMGAVLAVGGVLHAGTQRPHGFIVYFAALMVALMAANTLSSGRNLALPYALELMGTVGSESAGWSKWLQRGVMLFLLAASCERLGRFAFAQRLPGRPINLMVAFAACWVATVALPAAMGARPSLHHEYVYALVIGMAALTTDEKGGWIAIRVCRNALLVFVALSLLVLAVRRDMVLAPYLGGLIPGFAWRYSGLATGPNAMGPLCVLLLLCLRVLPLGRRFWQYLAVTLTLLSLLLTQSKSSWLGGLLCYAGIILLSQRGELHKVLSDARRRVWIQLFLATLVVALVGLALAVASGLLQERVDRFFETQAGSDVLTLTGRNEIWAVAIDTFRHNPWFGYGPTIWDPYFRMKIGIPAAFHAHNQYINVLAAAGLMGGLGFLAYFGALLRRAWTSLVAYNGFVLGLLLLILTRSVSEVPFALDKLGGESLMQMLLLMVLAGAPQTTALADGRVKA